MPTACNIYFLSVIFTAKDQTAVKRVARIIQKRVETASLLTHITQRHFICTGIYGFANLELTGLSRTGRNHISAFFLYLREVKTSCCAKGILSPLLRHFLNFHRFAGSNIGNGERFHIFGLFHNHYSHLDILRQIPHLIHSYPALCLDNDSNSPKQYCKHYPFHISSTINNKRPGTHATDRSLYITTYFFATSLHISTITSVAFSIEGTGTNSNLPWKFRPPANILGQGSPLNDSCAPSVPPRIG